MAKELIQVRHELEASKRVSSEYAERTHAAEKSMAKSREAMHEANHNLRKLKEKHEQVLSEVQVQRNRVAKLRLTVRRYEQGEDGRNDEYYDTPGSPLAVGMHSGAHSPTRPVAIEDRPGWNNDVVIKQKPKFKKESGRDSEPSSQLAHHVGGGAPNSSSESGGLAQLGRTGGNDHLAHLRPSGVLTDSAGSVDGKSAMTADAATREVHSLQHLLATARSGQATAEKQADERQAQCDKLQALVAEADSRRDEQAEAAAAAAAEASALRHQLQAQREKVEAMGEERRAVKDATELAVQRSKEEHRMEHSASAFVLALELRDLEMALALQAQREHERQQAQQQRQRDQASQNMIAGAGARGGPLRGGSASRAGAPSARPLQTR